MVPVIKLIWVLIEYLAYPVEDYADGFWAFDTGIGETNLFIEMYVDIAKIAIGVVNFITFTYIPDMVAAISPDL